MAAFKGLAHYFRITNTFKAVIGTAIGKINNVFNYSIGLGRINKIGHAKFFGERTLPRVKINTDDFISANHARALNDIEANAAQAKNHDIRARLNLGRVHHRTNASSDAAADITNLIKGRVFTNFGEGDFRHHRVISKRRGAHIMKDLLAI